LEAKPLELIEQRVTLTLIEIASRSFAAADPRDDSAIGRVVQPEPLFANVVLDVNYFCR